MLLSSDEEDIEQMYQLKITIMIVSFIYFFFFWCLEKFGPIFRVSISMSILAIRGKRRQETVKMPKYDLK